MRKWLSTLFIVLSFGTGIVWADENDDETHAHKLALDLAGAFSNEGFKMRDGFWAGVVKPGERTVIAVNLYASNQYWFSAGVSDKSRDVTVELFDETGRQLQVDSYKNDGKSAAGFSPTSSGQYFVSLSIKDAPATCCVMYSYK